MIFTCFKITHPSSLVTYLFPLKFPVIFRLDEQNFFLSDQQILTYCCSLCFFTLINIFWTPGPCIVPWSILLLTFCYNENWQFICIFLSSRSFVLFCIPSQNDLVSDCSGDWVSLLRGTLFLPHLSSYSNKVRGRIPSQLNLNLWETALLFVTTSMEIKNR